MTKTMNIILFTNRRGQVWNFEISPLRSALIAMAGVIIICGATLYAGFRLGGNELVYSEFVDVDEWQEMFRRQEAEIASAREAAQANLDALTLRVGQMQAQMLRLNALGERLVRQADLDGAEFDFDSLPAIGGPHDASGLPATEMPDFLAMLDVLDVELEDRGNKLTVLETLLMDRNLRARVMPSGRPIGDGWLSSKFGKRSDPFSGRQEYHKGVDFAGKEGSDIMAVGDGVVTWAGERSGYGNLVEINHGNGYVTRYGHNKEQLVEVGDTIKKGQLIALMGSTGRSTGPHVHFEVLRNGRPVNPKKYLKN